MDNRVDSGTDARLKAVDKDLAPIIIKLAGMGCLVGQCEKAMRDIRKVIDKRIKLNSAIFMVAMFIEAVVILLMP